MPPCTCCPCLLPFIACLPVPCCICLPAAGYLLPRRTFDRPTWSAKRAPCALRVTCSLSRHLSAAALLACLLASCSPLTSHPYPPLWPFIPFTSAPARCFRCDAFSSRSPTGRCDFDGCCRSAPTLLHPHSAGRCRRQALLVRVPTALLSCPPSLTVSHMPSCPVVPKLQSCSARAPAGAERHPCRAPRPACCNSFTPTHAMAHAAYLRVYAVGRHTAGASHVCMSCRRGGWPVRHGSCPLPSCPPPTPAPEHQPSIGKPCRHWHCVCTEA